MRAIIITHPGGPEVLAIQERPLPEPGPSEVRVRVLVAGLNRADIMQRQGQYPAPPCAPRDIPGLEVMGVVDALGPGATVWQKGHRVFGQVGGGGYAEFVTTHERLLAPVPDSLSDIEAGAVPETFMTAHDALFTQAGLVLGERVLIHAVGSGFTQPGRVMGERVLVHTVGSGVSTAAMQLAKAIGCTTYGTARSPEKLEKLESAQAMGLDVALLQPDFVTAIREATSGAGVNVIVDFVGGTYFGQNLKVLAPQGRLVQVGTLAGSWAEINLDLVMRKRLRIIGTVLRSRPLEEKIAVTRRFAEQVVPLLERGAVRPVVDRVFGFEQAAEAQAYMGSNGSLGNILLRIGTP